MRKAREEAVIHGLPHQAQQTNMVAAVPPFLRLRVKGSLELPRLEVKAMERGSKEAVLGVTEYLAENGLIDDLAVELVDMIVPLNDPARRGELLGRMMERWEEWEQYG